MTPMASAYSQSVSASKASNEQTWRYIYIYIDCAYYETLQNWVTCCKISTFKRFSTHYVQSKKNKVPVVTDLPQFIQILFLAQCPSKLY